MWSDGCGRVESRLAKRSVSVLMRKLPLRPRPSCKAANEFALSDALALLGVGKKVLGKRGSAKTKSKAKAATDDRPLSGVKYKHPQTGKEWTAPEKLRRMKKWLEDLVTSSGKKYEDFAVKSK